MGGHYNGSSGLVEISKDFTVGPELTVSGGSPAQVITNGDSSPATADGTEFGSVLVCANPSSVSHTFTVTNPGTGTVNLTGLTFTGANPGDFSPSPSFVPTQLTGPGGTTTFTVKFNPSGTGPRSATLTLSTSVGAYTFALSGTGIAPQMSVYGGSPPSLISYNSTSFGVYSGGNGTDFGPVSITGSVALPFTILNSGNAPLNLTGPIPGSPDLVVILDSTGNPSTDFICNSSQEPTSLQPTSPISVLAPFQITFHPTTPGLHTATVYILSNDCSHDLYIFHIQGKGDGPAIIVRDTLLPNDIIAKGDLSPTPADHTDFGSAALNVNGGLNSFDIVNLGNTPLNINSIEIRNDIGTQPNDFLVFNRPPPLLYVVANFPNTTPAIVLPGLSNRKSFTVLFLPIAPGLRTAHIEITTNDPLNPSYIFAVQGNGLGTPKIEVTGSGNLITSGSLPANNGTRFGTLAVGASTTNNFKIHNITTANSPLHLTGIPPELVKITLLGSTTASPDFTCTVLPLQQPASSTIPSSSSVPFDITFAPTQTGPATRTALVTILNDAPNQGTYTFQIEGHVGKPGIKVTGNTYPILNGDNSPWNDDFTDFGQTPANTPVTRTFYVINPGNTPLSITSTTPLPTSAGFVVNSGNGFTTSIADANSPAVPFTVTFNPGNNTGVHNATIKLTNNATSSTFYTFDVTCNVVSSANMRVIGNNNFVADGFYNPSPVNHTNFGQVPVNGAGGLLTRTFTIENHGPNSLNLNGTLNGTPQRVKITTSLNLPSTEFTCTQQPLTSSIAGVAGSIISSTTFKITFNPNTTGFRFGFVSIPSNDPYSPYTFLIKGEGTKSLWSGGGFTLGNDFHTWLRVPDIVSGGDERMALMDDGGLSYGQPRAFSWGLNDMGQLGNGSTTPVLTPSLASSFANLNLVDLAAGENHSVALAADGRVHVWGDNSLGQLGTGGNPTPSLVPVALPAFVGSNGSSVNIVHVAAGRSHSLALTEEGRIFAWGDNSQGQLGTGLTLNQSVPVPVNQSGPISSRSIVALAAGENHSVALAADGSVFTWGGNSRGQLGTGNTTPSLVPVQVDLGGRKALSLVAGPAHTLILTYDGLVFGWGRNDLGQLGDGTTTDRLMPVPLFTTGAASGHSFVALATGASHTLVLADDDTVFGCGSNSFGQLGTGNTTSSLVPVALPNFGPGLMLRGLAAGASHSVFLAADGRFFACGDNTFGQLGDGTTTPSLVRIPGLPGQIADGSRVDRVISGPFASRTHLLARAPAPFGALGVTDNPNLGRTPLGGTLSRTVSIINNGLVPLLLTGTPPVTVSGDNAGDFTVVQPTIMSVAPGGTLAITVKFTPSASGQRSAMLSVATNDPFNPVLGFSIFGSTTTAGAADSDFVSPGLNSPVMAVALQPDGGILFGGSFTAANPGGATPGRIARLDPTGLLDPAFNPNANGPVNALAVQFDNSILIGGNFTTIGGLNRSRLARLLANGSPHPLFNPSFDGPVNALALQPDGGILVAGSFTTVNGTARLNFARLNADGSLDRSFNPAPNRAVYAVALQADQKILIGGNFDMVSGSPRQRLARLNADGTLDTTFTPAPNSDVTAILLQGTKIVIAGQFNAITTAAGDVPRVRLARFDANGSLDTTFHPEADSAVYALAAQNNGKLLVAGSFNNLNGVACSRLGRLNFDGTLDTTFSSPAPIDDVIRALAIQDDGRIVLGGAFVGVGTESRPFLTRLDNDPASDTVSIPDASKIRWGRSGASPVVTEVRFEQSTDGGLSWLNLGNATALVTGTWELTGRTLAGDGLVRARARAPGGSPGLIESASYPFQYPAAPVILVSPVNSQTVLQGGTASFTVVASGFPAPAYQWLKVGGASGGIPIPGATESTYSIGSVSPDDQGLYRVLVSNTSGSVLSISVSLAVTPVNSAPVIHLQPAGQAAPIGASVTLSVAATGSPVPSFQWLKDGKNVPGANGSSLTIPYALPTDSATYSVVVNNSAASLTSDPAVVTVGSAPALTSAASATFVTGVNGLFTVTASGDPAPSFAATGLPAWLTLDPETGILSGTPADTSGSPYALQLTATNLLGTSPAQPFTLLVKTRFQVWREANFSAADLANPSLSGPDATPYGDGIPNLLRFATVGGKVTPALKNTAGGPRLTLRFMRPVQNPGVRYVVETSDTLGLWTTDGVDLNEISNDGTTSTWEASIPADPSSKRRFLHLKVSVL